MSHSTSGDYKTGSSTLSNREVSQGTAADEATKTGSAADLDVSSAALGTRDSDAHDELFAEAAREIHSRIQGCVSGTFKFLLDISENAKDEIVFAYDSYQPGKSKQFVRAKLCLRSNTPSSQILSRFEHSLHICKIWEEEVQGKQQHWTRHNNQIFDNAQYDQPKLNWNHEHKHHNPECEGVETRDEGSPNDNYELGNTERSSCDKLLEAMAKDPRRGGKLAVLMGQSCGRMHLTLRYLYKLDHPSTTTGAISRDGDENCRDS